MGPGPPQQRQECPVGVVLSGDVDVVTPIEQITALPTALSSGRLGCFHQRDEAVGRDRHGHDVARAVVEARQVDLVERMLTVPLVDVEVQLTRLEPRVRDDVRALPRVAGEGRVPDLKTRDREREALVDGESGREVVVAVHLGPQQQHGVAARQLALLRLGEGHGFTQPIRWGCPVGGELPEHGAHLGGSGARRLDHGFTFGIVAEPVGDEIRGLASDLEDAEGVVGEQPESVPRRVGFGGQDLFGRHSEPVEHFGREVDPVLGGDRRGGQQGREGDRGDDTPNPS